ncbi:MAG: tetratricopeptide repeat protein [Verrucomicrobiota bacterium]
MRSVRLRLGLVAGGLALAVLAVFWPAMHCGFVNYDDPEYVTTNRNIQQGFNWRFIGWALTSSLCSNWHPLTWVSHLVDFQLYGLSAAGHHLTSVLFHLSSSVLLLLLLNRLTGALWRSALAAALFALHPLRVESVVWIAERKDVLAGFLWMLTLWAYVRYAEELKAQGAKVKGYYAAALVLFALGLMAKPMVVTLPFALLLLDYWPLRRPWRVAEKIPFFALAVLSSVVTFVVQYRTGAVSSLAGLSLGARLANVPVAYVRYLSLSFWPSGLVIFYPYQARPWWEIGGAVCLLALISGLVLWRRRAQPYLPMGWFWFIGVLVPVIGVVQAGSQAMADRFTYLPCVGLWIMVVWGLAELTAGRLFVNRIFAFGGVLAVIACALLTWRHIGTFHDSETLWRAELRQYPACFLAHNNLGKWLLENNRLPEALEQCRTALAIRPDDPMGENNLARVLLRQGNVDDAIAHGQRCVQLQPKSEEGPLTLGHAYLQKGDPATAAVWFRKALEINPDLPHAWCHLGYALLQLGRLLEAELADRQALALDPAYAVAHNDLGNILLRQGRHDAALEQFQRAASLKPDFGEAHYNVAEILLYKGRTNEALAEYQKALDAIPNLAPARHQIAEILRRQGRQP